MTIAEWFVNGLKHLDEGVNWDTDTIKIALLGSSATIDQNADEFFSHVNADQVTGTGYTAGGQALTTSAPAVSGGELRFDAVDAAWDASGGSLAAEYAVIYKDTGNASTSPLLGYYDFESLLTATNASFTIQFGASGCLSITV